MQSGEALPPFSNSRPRPRCPCPYPTPPIFVQERKGDAMLNESKVEALRMLTSSNLAGIDIELVRLLFYGSDEMVRLPGFTWRAPWLLSVHVLNELTFEEVKEHSKSQILPLRVQHLLARSTGIESVGESVLIDLNCSFAGELATGCSDALDLLRIENFEVPIHQA